MTLRAPEQIGGEEVEKSSSRVNDGMTGQEERVSPLLLVGKLSYYPFLGNNKEVTCAGYSPGKPDRRPRSLFLFLSHPLSSTLGCKGLGQDSVNGRWCTHGITPVSQRAFSYKGRQPLISQIYPTPHTQNPILGVKSGYIIPLMPKMLLSSSDSIPNLEALPRSKHAEPINRCHPSIYLC